MDSGNPRKEATIPQLGGMNVLGWWVIRHTGSCGHPGSCTQRRHHLGPTCLLWPSGFGFPKSLESEGQPGALGGWELPPPSPRTPGHLEACLGGMSQTMDHRGPRRGSLNHQISEHGLGTVTGSLGWCPQPLGSLSGFSAGEA